MEYIIRAYYQTGNSFNCYDEEMEIEYVWRNLTSAQKSLQRIKNHYEYYKKYHNLWEKPKEALPSGVYWNNEYKFIGLTLLDDNSKEFGYNPPWLGYFEKLKWVEISLNTERNRIYF